MVTFRTNTSSTVKKLQISISFESNYRKQCLCYLLFLKWWKPRFLISERVFHRFLPNYKEFAHETSHTQPSKYDSTFGTKISICLKKSGGWGCGSEQAPLNLINVSTFCWQNHYFQEEKGKDIFVESPVLQISHKNNVYFKFSQLGESR